MSHEWDRGILNESSWHGLEEVGTFLDGDALIEHGRRVGSYPVQLSTEKLFTKSGLQATNDAIVASYQEYPQRVVGVVGGRYNATTPEQWDSLIKAASEAGAKPTGAFSLRGGSRVLATFEVDSSDDTGIRRNLVIADSFDGSLSLTVGFTSIRVVCANTMSAFLTRDGKSSAKLRHTASLTENIGILSSVIQEGIESGNQIVDLYKRARDTQLSHDDAMAIFNKLFPEAPLDASNSARTRAQNVRKNAIQVANLDINREGSQRGNLATLWNAATYMVDRKANGKLRSRGTSNPLESMLFGSKQKKIAEIQKVIEVVMTDGSVENLTVTEAREHGIDDRQIGSQLLKSILDDSPPVIDL